MGTYSMCTLFMSDVFTEKGGALDSTSAKKKIIVQCNKRKSDSDSSTVIRYNKKQTEKNR